MLQRLDAYLVLGCNGSTSSDGFTSCHGVENSILDLVSFDNAKYQELIDFFNDACDLFSTPMNDYNKCVNTLSYLYKFHSAYDEKMLYNIQNFIRMHKNCGIWIMLVLKEDFNYE